MRPRLEMLVLTEEMREAAHKAVEEAAYFKWKAAGCPAGDSLAFWLEAEAEWIEHYYVPLRYPVPHEVRP